MYEMESVDKKSVATYTQQMLETIGDEYVCIKIAGAEKNGETVYKVDTGYEAAGKTVMEISTVDVDSIGSYLEGRMNEEMGDLEVAYRDEKYTVSRILEED